MSTTIRPLAVSDRASWDGLFEQYAAFYKVPQTPQMRDTVFGWLMDDGHESSGLVAETADGTLIGLTHYRPFASSLRAITNCYLDDLFVTQAARGSGAANALVDGVVQVGRAKGWGVVRWITAENNYRARGVYDKIADRTSWVTYDIKL